MSLKYTLAKRRRAPKFPAPVFCDAASMPGGPAEKYLVNLTAHNPRRFFRRAQREWEEPINEESVIFAAARATAKGFIERHWEKPEEVESLTFAISRLPVFQSLKTVRDVFAMTKRRANWIMNPPALKTPPDPLAALYKLESVTVMPCVYLWRVTFAGMPLCIHADKAHAESRMERHRAALALRIAESPAPEFE